MELNTKTCTCDSEAVLVILLSIKPFVIGKINYFC